MKSGELGPDHEEFMAWVNNGGDKLARKLFDNWLFQHSGLIFATGDTPIVSKTQVKKAFFRWLNGPMQERAYIVRSIHYQLRGINFIPDQSAPTREE